MLHHILISYKAIEKIDQEDTAVKTMGLYDPAVPLSRLIEQLEKYREFMHTGGHTISNLMMVPKGITLLTHMAMFNTDIKEWRLKTTDLNTCFNYKTFFHQAIVIRGER